MPKIVVLPQRLKIIPHTNCQCVSVYLVSRRCLISILEWLCKNRLNDLQEAPTHEPGCLARSKICPDGASQHALSENPATLTRSVTGSTPSYPTGTDTRKRTSPCYRFKDENVRIEGDAISACPRRCSTHYPARSCFGLRKQG